jgi:Bax protein
LTRYRRLAAGALAVLCLAWIGVSHRESASQALSEWGEGSLPLGIRTVLESGGSDPRRRVAYLPDQSDALRRYFEQLRYTLPQVRQDGMAVPRVYLASLPVDLEQVGDTGLRKSLFIRGILPIVLRENERLRGLHSRLMALRERIASGALPGSAEREWLADISALYGVQPGDLERLARRMDAVPPSLAVAQAALESGWGTSRFAVEGNALFGQWTWSPEVQGMVPLERPDDARHKVRAFGSLEEAVRAYMHTLNTHWAYQDFRERRFAQRRSADWLDGVVLAAGLSRYSQLRMQYIRHLRTLILSNGLNALDEVRLSAARTLPPMPRFEPIRQVVAAEIVQLPGR